MALPGKASAVPPILSSQEIATLACSRSRIVIMNEAHDGLLRMTRARRLGKALLPAFRAGGIKVLAAEALSSEDVREANRTRRFPQLPPSVGYLGQPEMRALFQEALDLGMDLAHYEADLLEYRAQRKWFDARSVNEGSERERFGGEDWNRFRELNQAQHLGAVLERLQPQEKILVWCGNGHLKKTPIQVQIPGWSDRPYELMGSYLRRLSGQEPFCIDQTVTAEWPGNGMRGRGAELLRRFSDQLTGPEESGGLLVESFPTEDRPDGVDALILSRQNQFE